VKHSTNPKEKTMNATTTKTTKLTYGNLVWDELDSRYVRVSKIEADGMVEVMDRDSLKALPDLRHPSQLPG